MVHLRLNAKDSNPNPHINFISSLSIGVSQDEDEAKHLLRALAAQVRPIMKHHGFVINSFEEYEYNQVFAGRNWEAGEVVELVLRRPGGSFYPMSWLLSTLCHELAHVRHMHHGPEFQKLWKTLNAEVRALQQKGYYGDGYWSSGTRLGDSSPVSGEGAVIEGDLPEFICGGALERRRPNAFKRRRRGGRRRETKPSLHTGRQTAVKRKAGAKITSKYAFTGEGAVLSADHDGSKGRQANSRRAREERLKAIERRIKPSEVEEHDQIENSDDDDIEIIGTSESDDQRRRTLLESMSSGEEQEKSQSSWEDMDNDYDDIELDSSIFDEIEEQYAVPGTGGQTMTPKANDSSPSSKIGTLVQDEISFRKLKASGSSRSLNTRGRGSNTDPIHTAMNDVSSPEVNHSSTIKESNMGEWSCQVCTLINKEMHLQCLACGSVKGRLREAIYSEQPDIE